MSDPVDPSIVPTSGTQNAEAQSVQSATQAPKSAASSGKTYISSLSQLKELDPEVYNATLKSIAQNIIRDMKEYSARLKKMMREGQR